jgi:beta-galactosidase
VVQELRDAPDVTPVQSQVALIFDYEADWAWQIQPHAKGPILFRHRL